MKHAWPPLVVLLIALSQACMAQKRPVVTHVHIRPGLELASMRSTDTRGTAVSFPQGRNVRFGIELEFPLRRRTSWAFVAEPTYQRYVAYSPLYLKYQSIEIPLSIRRYFSLRSGSRLFLNASFVGDLPLDLDIELSPGIVFQATSFAHNLALGGGIAFKRIALEYRQYTRRTTEDDTGSFTFYYNKQSVILGLRVL